MEICELDFRSRRKEKLILFQTIHVGFELRELRCADHAIAPDQKRRTNLDITMLTRVQVDHEIDQGAFQLRACAGETNKTAAAQFCRPIKIEKIQSCAEHNVIDRLGQSRLLAPTAHDPICAGVFANRDALMRHIWNFQ